MLLVTWERETKGSIIGWTPSRHGDARCDGCSNGSGPCQGYLCDGCDRCQWNCVCDEAGGHFSDAGRRIITRELFEWRSGLTDTVWCHHCETHYFLSDLVSTRIFGTDQLVCPDCMDEPYGIGVWDMHADEESYCSVCLQRAAILQDSRYPGCYEDCPRYRPPRRRSRSGN